MRPMLMYVCGLAVAVLMLSAMSAHAQTTAVGPYYATPSWIRNSRATPPPVVHDLWCGPTGITRRCWDRETGLVWERGPSDMTTTGDRSAGVCSNKIISNRQGWRLPSVQELRSLIDPSRSLPALPSGHPFTNLFFGTEFFPEFYWTASEDSLFIVPAGDLLLVTFSESTSSGSAPRNNVAAGRVWCVRGGQGALLQ